MKMNKKVYFNLLFTIVGTFVLVTMAVIVAANFVKDSRLLHWSSAAAVQQTAKPASTPSPESTDMETTYKYKRAVDAVPEKADHGEAMPKSTASPIPEASKIGNGIKVEVVNYSGIKNLAEEIRTILESAGFIVSTSNATSLKPVPTTIIEWNDKKVGTEVQKLIRAGKIVKSSDPNSRFDITVEIGDDFKP